MKSLVRYFLVILGSLAAVGTSAQTNPNPPRPDSEVIRVDTELVDVPVEVTDKAGKPILNLKRQNFVVYEDGKLQELTDFSATTAPFEVALLLDTSGSTRSDLELIQRSARLFIDSLRPGDRVSLIAYNTKRDLDRAFAITEVLNELTEDRTTLTAAVAKVSTSNGTPYYDSLLQVATQVFGSDPSEQFRGRRALVALTDGVDSTSSAEFEEASSELRSRGIISYFIQVDTRPFFEENLLGDCASAIRFSQAQIRRYYRSFGRGSNVERTTDFCQLGDFERLAISKRLYELADSEMAALAKASGGKVFPVADLNEARSAFRSVAGEIGTKYSLGYYPSNDKRDGTYRKIKVELKGLPPGSTVRAREGYNAPAH
jgi:VWFA-related protein